MKSRQQIEAQRFGRLERAIASAAHRFESYVRRRPLEQWDGEDLYAIAQRLAPFSKLFFQSTKKS
jgi:hypothetical protein